MSFRRRSRKLKKAKCVSKSKQHNPGRSFEQLEPRLMLEGINFVHPGVISTDADYTRMAAKVAAQAQPWLTGYNALISDGYSQLGASPRPLAVLTVADVVRQEVEACKKKRVPECATSCGKGKTVIDNGVPAAAMLAFEKDHAEICKK